ncbi:MAG: FtsX-like permease family protein [Actinobacteria bacterium]|nr:FtsX-like permease family protein [Actinomycetota bacterium]
MSQLNKKLVRDLATHWTQVSAIVIVVALGIVMFLGPLLAQRDLRDSIEEIYKLTRYEDFSVEVSSAPVESVEQVRSLDNVSAVEGRLSLETLAEVEGRQLTLRVISVPDVGRPSVNDVLVEEGSYLAPGGENGCMVEHHLASEFGLEQGDTVRLLRDNGDVSLGITGSVVSPEYLRLVGGRGEYVADPSRFGVVFVSYSECARIFGSPGLVNDYVARVFDQNLLEGTMVKAGSALERYGVVGLRSGSDEPAAAMLKLEVDDFGKIAVFFALLLLIVASLALYVTMTLIVFSQQRQIGVTRATGYSRRSLMVHYIGYGVVLGATGSALGVIGGYYLSWLIIHLYAGILEIPLVKVSLYGGIVATGVCAGLLFSVIGAVVPAWHSVKMKPAEAMRTEAGLSLGVGKRHHPLESTRFSRLPMLLRVPLRNLARNRSRTVLTFLGVAATVCLLVTGSGAKDSLDYTVDKHLHGVLKWDVAAVFSRPVGEGKLNEIKGLQGVTGAEPMISFPARLEAGGESEDVQVQAFLEGTAFHGSYPTPGSRAEPGPGEILLNRGITKVLGVKLGDTVNISIDLGSLEPGLQAAEPAFHRALPFEVVGFVAEPFGGTCYVDLGYLQRMAGMYLRSQGVETGGDLFNVVVAGVSEGQEESVASELRGLPGVSQVYTRSTALIIFEELVEAVRVLFIIFYVMAFAMGFAIMFTMITVNVMERRREVATVRTLGAGWDRIFTLLTMETVLVVGAALVPGILLGWLLEWVLVERLLTSERIVPDTVLSGGTIALVIAATFVVMIISELPSIRRLLRMDLALETKERAD